MIMQGKACSGKAGFGLARSGQARQGMARSGKSGLGKVIFCSTGGGARRGASWRCAARHGQARKLFVVLRPGKARRGMVRHGLAR